MQLVDIQLLITIKPFNASIIVYDLYLKISGAGDIASYTMKNVVNRNFKPLHAYTLMITYIIVQYTKMKKI